MVIVVFGVSGTGKTRVRSALAEALGWMFIDADDFHEEATPSEKCPMGGGHREPLKIYTTSTMG